MVKDELVGVERVVQKAAAELKQLVAVHRRLCYPHVTSAAVVYGGRSYWTNGQRICLTRSRKTLRLLQYTKLSISLLRLKMEK